MSAAGGRPEAGAPRPVCVVTGGSEGIGYALAMQFAKSGSDILLVARTVTNLETAAAAIRAATGRRVETAAIDLTGTAICEQLDAELEKHGFYCDILINNAGIGLGGEFTSHETADVVHLIDLNIRALTELMHHYLPGMLARGEGGVLNVASLGGMLPGPYQAAYYASKAYVISLTRAVAVEISGSGVRMCVLAPGPVATRFHERMSATSALYLKLPGTISAERTARAAHFGYRLRRTVIVPGLLAWIGSLFLNIIPQWIMAPFMGVLLKKRYR